MAWRLNLYFTKIFCQYFMIILGIIALGSFLLTLGETFSEDFSNSTPSTTELILLALYKTPDHLQKIMPMTVLISAITYFVLLARSQQLLIAQQAGKPLIKLSILPLAAIVMIGLVNIFLLNPLAATFLERHENFMKKYSQQSESILSVAKTGIWLRQNVGEKTWIIRARAFDSTSQTFLDTSLFEYEGLFQNRYEAKLANVQGNQLVLDDVWVYPLSGLNYQQDSISIGINIDKQKIQESFQKVRTISIYQLNTFISAVESAGFSAREHQSHLHRLLSSPIILLAMFLLAGSICAKSCHRRLPHWQIFFTLAIGLTYFVFITTFQSVGLFNEWPLIFTIWIPHLLFFSLVFTYILHSESLQR